MCNNSTKKTVGLYVHIPFCATKCPYCDFYSVKYSLSQEQAYIEAVITEILSYKGCGWQADTLYFGGGTPSLLRPHSIERVITAAVEAFNLSGEITVEANPNSVSPTKLAEYHRMGVNRISFGMQSAQVDELSALGRTHSPIQTVRAVESAFDAGILNISLDLMLGTPYQTLQSMDCTINSIVKLPVNHLSAYMLQIEEGTPYAAASIRDRSADEDTLAEMYLSAIDTLNAGGFAQYEISNFGRNGAISQHNLKYWRLNEYIGFGASAHSYLDGERFFHSNDIDMYISSKGGDTIVTDTSCGGADEYIMLGLRLNEGIDLSMLKKTYNVSLKNLTFVMNSYQKRGCILCEHDRLSLTGKGFLLSNTIINDVISAILP